MIGHDGITDIVIIDREIGELHCGIAFEPVSNDWFSVGVLFWNRHESASERHCSNFAIIDDHLSAAEDVAGEAKHGFKVILSAVDADIGIGTGSQVSFGVQSQHAGRCSASNDGDFTE